MYKLKTISDISISIVFIFWFCSIKKTQKNAIVCLSLGMSLKRSFLREEQTPYRAWIVVIILIVEEIPQEAKDGPPGQERGGALLGDAKGSNGTCSSAICEFKLLRNARSCPRGPSEANQSSRSFYDRGKVRIRSHGFEQRWTVTSW